MKKIKLILSALIMMSLLVACGGGKETVTVCEGEISGIQGATGTAEYTAKGDNITGYRTVQTIPYESFGMSKEEVKAGLEAADAALETTDNLISEYEFNEDAVTMTVTIKELSKATDNEFDAAGLSVTQGTKISLKRTIELQESSTNMTCTLKGE